MQKHAPQLSDLIAKQKPEHDKFAEEHRQKKAKEEQAKQEASEKKYIQLKTNSCDSITTTASFLILKAMQEADGDDVSGCFGKSSSPKSSKTPMSPTKRKQALLDPIRRWNSFHSRDKKSNASVARSFEQFRRDYGKKMAAEAEQATSQIAAGLMGALPRVVALRNESLPQESKLIKQPTKETLAVEAGPGEKLRRSSLMSDDSGVRLSGGGKEEETKSDAKLNRQKSREKIRERWDPEKVKRCNDREKVESDEGKTKLVRRKTKEKLTIDKEPTAKPRRWSDRDDDENIKVEIDGTSIIVGLSSSEAEEEER